MKLSFVLIVTMLLIIAAAFSLSYNGSANYSPLDTYIKAVEKNAQDSIRHITIAMRELKKAGYKIERIK